MVLRIATVGLSLASAITTLTASSSAQCGSMVDDGSCSAAGGGGASSSTDYGSFTYSSVASLVSALLQGVVICLEVVGEEKWSSTVEFIDAVVMALTSTSVPLLLAADNITSCGRKNNGARRQNKALDEKLRPAAGFGIAALTTNFAKEAVAKPFMKHSKAAPTSPRDIIEWTPWVPPPAGDGEEKPPPPQSDKSTPPGSPPCSGSCPKVTPPCSGSCPTVIPPCSGSCPTVTPPCCCGNRDPCGASTWS